MYENYLNMPDEEVVKIAQTNDNPALEYLLNKYKNFVRSKARSYFLIGADHEDIVQEGMIGLYKAIRDFREDRQSSSGLLRNCALPARLLPRSKPRQGRSTFP